MNVVSEIGFFLKQLYRIYSNLILEKLEARGFTDLRPSFLEILVYVSEHDGPTMSQIGKACLLKKQTMTSHTKELIKRGYLKKIESEKDKREQRIYFTEMGERFRLNLLESISDTEQVVTSQLGAVEMLRIKETLENFYNKVIKLYP